MTIGVLSCSVGDRAVLAAGLAQVDDHGAGLAAFEPGDRPLEAVVAARAGLAPAGRLEVGQEDDLFLGDRRDGEHAVDRAEAGRQVGPAVRQGDLLDLLEHLGVVGRGVADDDARRVAHHDDADGVAAAGVAHELRGQRLGLLEAGGARRRVGHAQRPVEHQHAMRALARHDRQRPQALQEGLGHRGDDQDDDQGPHGQEEPLLDPDPPRVLADRGQQEPHRGPGHLAVLAPVEQVDDDRHRRRAEPVDQRVVGQPQGEHDRHWQRRLPLICIGLSVLRDAREAR